MYQKGNWDGGVNGENKAAGGIGTSHVIVVGAVEQGLHTRDAEGVPAWQTVWLMFEVVREKIFGADLAKRGSHLENAVVHTFGYYVYPPYSNLIHYGRKIDTV